MALLFDLDGTLTDPEEGITKSIQHALTRLGRPSPTAERLRRCIGPPLHESFRELLACDETAVIERAIEYYRERFAPIGIYENIVYPRVPDTLASLRAGGQRLWVATSKHEVFDRRVLDHFGLTSLFDGIYGSELDGARANKRELIAYLLQREALDPAGVWMIGDRAHDIAGGRGNGIRAIGALWGYGGEHELREAGADQLARSIDEVPALLRGGATPCASSSTSRSEPGPLRNGSGKRRCHSGDVR